eukprot:jgi/Mesen1/5296/ME000264S04321
MKSLSVVAPTGNVAGEQSLGEDSPCTPKTPGVKRQGTGYSRFIIVTLIVTNTLWGFLLRGEDAVESASSLRQSFSVSEQLSSMYKKRSVKNESSYQMHDLNSIVSDEYDKFTVRIRKRRPAKGYSLQSFVLFSSYRTGPATFTAMGLAALAFHTSKKAEACRWAPSEGGGADVMGSVAIHYPGESHRLPYETILLFCTLNTTSGGRGSGSGSLFITIDSADVLVYTQTPDSGILQKVPPTYKSNITHCSAPLYGKMHPGRVQEWMEFHERVHGVDSFIMYDAGGIDEHVMRVLEPYIREGRLQITDVRDTVLYETWLYSQVLLVNDCVYRTRFSAKWSLFMDFDEYLNFPQDGTSLTLPQFLSTRSQLPWITFGSVFFSCKHCTKPKNTTDDRWAAEKLVYHEPWVHCKNTSRFRNREMCLKYEGHRKYVVQPSMINVLQIHRVMNPGKGGVNAPAKEARINHYRGLAGSDKVLCRYYWDDNESPTDLVSGTLVSKLAKSARLKQVDLELD